MLNVSSKPCNNGRDSNSEKNRARALAFLTDRLSINETNLRTVRCSLLSNVTRYHMTEVLCTIDQSRWYLAILPLEVSTERRISAQ